MSSPLVKVALATCLVAGLGCGSSTQEPGTDAGTPAGDAGQKPGPVDCSFTAPTACPDPMPRYADVEPIFEAVCLKCHLGEPDGPWSLRGYKHVSDWHDTIPPALRSCSMPPAGAEVPLSPEERTKLLTWFFCGLPE